MNRRTSIKFKQLFLITISWLIVGCIITVYDYLVLNTEYSLGLSVNYSFTVYLLLNSGAAFTGALLGGSFLVFYVNVKYRDKPYVYTIAAVSISFILIIILVAFLLYIISGNSSSGTTGGFGNFLFLNSRTVKNTIVWSIVVGLTQLFLQMNSKFGYGVFWNILRGKYNTPKEEKRIFMSLDINSSTSIAEKLGNEKYHSFLKNFFSDITNSILDNKGEIYQYVGDEVVIAWKYEDGISGNQCIKCFFDMKNNIEKRKGKYLSNYGIIPEFKAGIHSGRVTVGEIGIIKRDITYSGDVLNTTSRIRNKCKEFNVEILTSSDLLEKLLLKNYLAKRLGAIKLRGKEKEIYLSTLVQH